MISDSLDVSVAGLLIPYLQGFRSNRVEDREEPTLVRVFEHDALGMMYLVTDLSLFLFCFHYFPCFVTTLRTPSDGIYIIH